MVVVVLADRDPLPPPQLRHGEGAEKEVRGEGSPRGMWISLRAGPGDPEGNNSGRGQVVVVVPISTFVGSLTCPCALRPGEYNYYIHL